jgi:hypothetical protein
MLLLVPMVVVVAVAVELTQALMGITVELLVVQA